MGKTEVVEALKQMTPADQAEVLGEVFGGNWTPMRVAALIVLDDYLQDEELNVSKSMVIDPPVFPDEPESFLAQYHEKP